MLFQAITRIAKYDDLLMEHNVPGIAKRAVDPDVVDASRLMTKKRKAGPQSAAQQSAAAQQPYVPYTGHSSGFWIAEMGGRLAGR
jgi:hypothetical protein